MFSLFSDTDMHKASPFVRTAILGDFAAWIECFVFVIRCFVYFVYFCSGR